MAVRGVVEEVAVVDLIVGEFRVICDRTLGSRKVCGLDRRTFEYTNDTEEDTVVQYAIRRDCACSVALWRRELGSEAL